MKGYNGYNAKQRLKILRAYQRGEAGLNFTFDGKPCGLCLDPDRRKGEWHSEDYSEPFLFEAPATYPICGSCHSRLHKRFDRPTEEWDLFCLHIEAGGFGREFTSLHSAPKRAAMASRIRDGESVMLSPIRRFSSRPAWWRSLTLDPQSLDAPWARPRPLRPRPTASEFAVALTRDLTVVDVEILRRHAQAPRRSVTMRAVSETLGDESPQSANLRYGRLAKRLCQSLDWDPDKRSDGSPIWMSIAAEGWRSSGGKCEYEWVMVPSLAQAVDNLVRPQ